MSDPTGHSRRETLLVPGVFEQVVRRVRAGARTTVVDRLMTEAEESLQARVPSVLDKKHVPPTGDKRDYFTLSIYFWPDDTKPGGLPYAPRDGIVNPEIGDYDRPNFEGMQVHVDTLTLAYAISGDERFAAKAAEFLRTWFLDERTGMKPNMLFAQYIPGDDVVLPWKDYPARYVPGTDGRPGVYVSFGGTIEDLNLIPLTDSIRLLRGSSHWTDADDTGMQRWYRNYTQWLLTHQHGLDEAYCRNNHGSWYWSDLACFKEFTGEPADARARIQSVLPERYRLQIQPDGSHPEEMVRAISKSYTAFTLCSFTNIACSMDRCDLDVWALETPDGRSLRRSIDWFLPYLTGDQEWTWRQIKPFDSTIMLGPLRACAKRFPDAGYEAALRRIPDVPTDHRYRLIYDVL